jgi:predicted extracellular nuclease
MSNPSSHPLAKSQFYFSLFFLSIFILLLSSTYSAEAISPNIVISQVYGGGGNSGATLTNDFIELFNLGDSPVNVAGWSVQYASSSGTTWQVTALSGSIAPGQYFLVQEAAGTGGTTPLPTPNVLGNIPMSATSGKVALVSNTTALSGSCPSGVVDLVGYGAANCFEGSRAAPGLTNTTADSRNDSGCAETDDNAADFTAG